MNILSKILGRLPTLTSPALVVPTTLTIGMGKWVVLNNAVGIVANNSGFPVCEIHLVDDKGLTVGAVKVTADQLRIAKYLEIPKARRPENYAYAAAILGYV
jgi:hypothetical protein